MDVRRILLLSLTRVAAMLAQEVTFTEIPGVHHVLKEANVPASTFDRETLASLANQQMADSNRSGALLVRLYSSPLQARFSLGKVYDLSYDTFARLFTQANQTRLCPSADIVIVGPNANVRYCGTDHVPQAFIIGDRDPLLVSDGLARVVFIDYWRYSENREVIETFILTDGPFDRATGLAIYRHITTMFPADGVRAHIAREPWFPMVSLFPHGYPFVKLIQPPSAELSDTWPRITCDDTVRRAEVCSVVTAR